MMVGKEKNILPDFPRTQHLPYKPNTAHGDTIAANNEVAIIFTSDLVHISEKIDGANTGICLYEGNPIIRNRNHILNKAFTQRRTAAKMQFASIFNWFYINMEKFEKANELLGFPAAIYGEWMYAVHGIHYDHVPDLWIPYDIYDWQANQFMDWQLSQMTLWQAGFCTPPVLHHGKVESWEQLEKFCNQKSGYSSSSTQEGKCEGIYLKVSNGKNITNRYKMVREGFVQGSLWKDNHITRNKVVGKPIS